VSFFPNLNTHVVGNTLKNTQSPAENSKSHIFFIHVTVLSTLSGKKLLSNHQYLLLGNLNQLWSHYLFLTNLKPIDW